MKKEELFTLIGEVDEAKILSAGKYIANDTSLMPNQLHTNDKTFIQKLSSSTWIRIRTIVACFCVILVIGTCFYQLKNSMNGGGFSNGLWGKKDTSVLEPHREDFSPFIEDEILNQFPENTEVLKSYVLLTNEWFLSEKLTDFSQALTTDCFYVVAGGKEGSESVSEISNQKAYSTYKVNENGKIEWSSSAYPLEDASVPNGFSCLTHNIIQDALQDVEYEDYIIANAPRLYTVFVWVRCSNEDFILAYPSRPDLIRIENGGIYTLKELQELLTKFYKDSSY